MRVQIAVLGDKSDGSFPIITRTTDTVLDLKAAIAESRPEYGDCTMQHLFYDGKELKEELKLGSVDVGIMRDDALLLLAFRPRDGISKTSTAAHLGIVGATYWPPELVKALDRVEEAFKAGFGPQRTEEGEGGTYFLRAIKHAEPWDDTSGAPPPDDSRGDSSDGTEFVACFKPRDEEQNAPNNPKRLVGKMGSQSSRIGILSGEAYMREVIAFMLDHGGVAGVPPTGLAKGWHENFHDRSRMSLQSPAISALPSVDVSEDMSLESSTQLSGITGTRLRSMSSASGTGTSLSPELCASEGERIPVLAPLELSAAPTRTLLNKVGSFQLFVPDAACSSDFGPAKFPVEEVQKIALFDIRMLNLDRNGENILVRHVMKDAPPPPPEAPTKSLRRRRQIVMELVPIDHGMILPSDLGVASCDWVWLSWPQVKEPLCDKLKTYFLGLDLELDIAKLRAAFGNQLRPQCYTTMRIAHAVLKRGINEGMSLYDIALLLCRPADNLLQKSTIERLVNTASLYASTATHNTRIKELISAPATFSHQELQARQQLELKHAAQRQVHSDASANSLPSLSHGVDAVLMPVRGQSDPLHDSNAVGGVSSWQPLRWHVPPADYAGPSLRHACQPLAISTARAASARHRSRIPSRPLKYLCDWLGINYNAPFFAHVDDIHVAVACANDIAIVPSPGSGSTTPAAQPSTTTFTNEFTPVARTSSESIVSGSEGSQFMSILNRKAPMSMHKQWTQLFNLPSQPMAITAVAVSLAWSGRIACVCSAPLLANVMLVHESEIRGAVLSTVAAGLTLVLGSLCREPAQYFGDGSLELLSAAQRLCDSCPTHATDVHLANARSSTFPNPLMRVLSTAGPSTVSSPYMKHHPSFRFDKLHTIRASSADTELLATVEPVETPDPRSSLSLAAMQLTLRRSSTSIESVKPVADNVLPPVQLVCVAAGPDCISDYVHHVSGSTESSLTGDQILSLSRFANDYGTFVGTACLRQGAPGHGVHNDSDWRALSNLALRTFGCTVAQNAASVFSYKKPEDPSLKIATQFKSPTSAPLLDSPVFGWMESLTPRTSPEAAKTASSPPTSSADGSSRANIFMSPGPIVKTGIAGTKLVGLQRTGRIELLPEFPAAAPETLPVRPMPSGDLRRAALKKNVPQEDSTNWGGTVPPSAPGLLRVSSYSAAISRMHDHDQRMQRHAVVPDTVGTTGLSAGAAPVAEQSISQDGPPSLSAVGLPPVRRLASVGPDIPSSASFGDLAAATGELKIAVPQGDAAQFTTAFFASPGHVVSVDPSRPTLTPLPSPEYVPSSFDSLFVSHFDRLLDSNADLWKKKAVAAAPQASNS